MMLLLIYSLVDFDDIIEGIRQADKFLNPEDNLYHDTMRLSITCVLLYTNGDEGAANIVMI